MMAVVSVADKQRDAASAEAARLLAVNAGLLTALRLIADFPNAPGNRDLTFSEAVAQMADLARAAIAQAEAR
jgi:hypothetical protein